MPNITVDSDAYQAMIDNYSGMWAEVYDEKKQLEKFFHMWELCESNRGCYSCVPAHDCRCPRYHHESAECECGRYDLEAAADAVRAK